MLSHLHSLLTDGMVTFYILSCFISSCYRCRKQTVKFLSSFIISRAFLSDDIDILRLFSSKRHRRGIFHLPGLSIANIASPFFSFTCIKLITRLISRELLILFMIYYIFTLPAHSLPQISLSADRSSI